jgi:hypothetical protein
LTVTNSATDPDVPFNTLTYTLFVSPLDTNAPAVTNAFISIDGIITWIPTEAQGPGDYLFTTIVTDTNPPAINSTSFSATNKFIVHVWETNSAPFWPTNYSDVVMDELTTTNIFATAMDTDLPPNILTYSLATNTPAWVSINATNGAIALSPLEVDGPSTNIITVIATDNGAPPLSGSTNFTVVVNEVNTAPYWPTNVPSQTNYITPALWTLVVTNTAADSDIPANLLTYTFSVTSTNPLDPPVTNALMDTNGIFVWTPTEAQAPAVYVVTTVVTDTNPWALFNQSLSATNTFIVTVVPKNLAPFWTTNYSDTNMDELTTAIISSTVVDLNIPTNSWTYALSNNTPAWVSINTNSGVITLAPLEVDGPSTNIITVFITDNGLPPLSSATNFTVVVNEVNTPPVPPTIPDQLVYAGEEIVVDASAYDYDVPANTLTYSLLNGPTGLVLNPTNGLITWTPDTNAPPSTNLVTVLATDTNPWALFNQSLSTNYYFYITVLPPFTNNFATGIPAFPGAEGAGGFAVGGRGGDVYHVVNTNDDGPGSLRYGTRASHRTIVFDVSGTIDLLSDLRITRQYLTIAGQTAPGDGITLKGRLTSVQNTHDIEVRFMHFRPGDVNCPTFQDDAFHFREAAMSIVDHVSASWSIDEVLSATYVTNVTVQWSMIADALNDSCHVKGLHGYGSLLRYGDGNVSYHHNLYADNYSRNPRLGDNLTLDFVNNVIANWGELPGYSGDSADLADNPLGFTNRMNYTGNYIIAGANSISPSRAFRSGDVTTWIYQSGNFIDANLNSSLDGANTGWGMFSGPFTQSGSPFVLTLPAVTTDTAQIAYERVLAFVGATEKRDLVDSNIVNHVRSQTGHIINSELEVGGWPTLASTTQPPDYDQDGMPDYWEVTLGLNALVPSNDNDRDGDGYTDLEEYLNWLAAPHAFLLHDTHVDVDLRAVAGNTGNLTFTVANGTNGTVILLGDGHTARFTPTAAYHGFASFSFNVNDTATGIAFGPVGVSVLVSLIDPFGANTPPVLPAQPDYLADTYVPLIITNTATDYDIPPQLLTYALLNAPTNVVIDTNGIITFIADDSQAGNIYTITTKVTDNGVPNLSATNSFQVAVSSGLTNDVPVTNFVGPNSVRFFRVKVPSNADIATNHLLFATPAGVSLWFTTNLPPSITNATDVKLLDNSTGGLAVLDTTNAPLLVPGSVYFLGVQNTNNFIEQFALKVTFHLVPFNFYISSIVQTNMSGTNGFLITWFAPTNTQFHLQWTPLLLPITWKEMKGVISFDSYISATNSHFSFFDDGDTNRNSAPFGDTRFYRLHLLNSPTNTAPEFLLTATNYAASPSVLFTVTNNARDWDLPPQKLVYFVTNSLPGTNVATLATNTSGVITWTPDLTQSGLTNFITTIVTDNGVPTKHKTNVLVVVVATVASPFANALPAKSVTGTSALLNGFATPNGSNSVAWFEWGASRHYGSTTAPVNVGSGNGVVYVTASIAGLINGQIYHCRLVVSNSFYTVRSFDEQFGTGQLVDWGTDVYHNQFGNTSVPAGLGSVVAMDIGYASSLALMPNGTVTAWGINFTHLLDVPAGLNNVVALAIAKGNQGAQCLALKSDGTVVPWGDNSLGQLNPPASVTNVVAVATGNLHSLALRADGRVIAWGTNFNASIAVPVGLSNVVAVAAGASHNLALKNDGTVVAWGYDAYGQIDLPAGLSNVVAVAAGSDHSLALKSDGTIAAWGNNGSGQTSVPAGLNNVVEVAGGDFHTLALKLDGSIIAWGDDSYGEIDTPASATNVVAVAAARYKNLALVSANPLTSTNPPPANLSIGSVSTGINGASFQWSAPVYDAFQVRWTTNLAPPVWNLFPDVITSTNGSFNFTDNNASALMKFYQLILLP